MSMNERLMIPVQLPQECPSIKFLDGQFLFEMTTLEGTKIQQLRSAPAVREAFTNIPVDSGWLSPNVVRWGDGRQGEWAVLWIPPGEHLLELTTDAAATAENVLRIRRRLPGLVMFGAGVNYWMWALKSNQFEPHHDLFRVPLPNVMADAAICWGPHKPPSCSGKSITRAFKLFISTTFSSHAASGKSKTNNEDVREILKTLDECQAYPVEDLVRYQEGLSIDKIIRAFGKFGALTIDTDPE